MHKSKKMREHKKSTIEKQKVKFKCEVCDFYTSKKSNFMTHIATKKHIIKTAHETQKSTLLKQNETKKTSTVSLQYVCKNCKCNFNSRTTLWRHKIKCDVKPNNSIWLFVCEGCHSRFNSIANLMNHKQDCSSINVINQTNEKINIDEKINGEGEELKHNFKIEREGSTSADQLLKLLPKLTDAMIAIAERPVNVNNNCTNKMTINMYLNEECKDAMNLTDFVNKVQISLDDLMYTQQHGYVKGISNIFVKQLQDMDPKDRPIHCSDKKRMQFYVKEEDKWEKDNQHSKIDNSIAKITHKQILKIREWEDKHPNFLEDDKLTHIWQKMCSETMGGAQDAERNKNCINIKKEVSNVIEVKEAMKD